MPRIIMHVDMDAFFAAIEQRDRPQFRQRPVVVGALPGSRGVVSTCSYQARTYGVHSAMPISEAYSRCPHAVFLRPDMGRYTEVSQQLLEILESISPLCEQVSVDEAFVDISGLDMLFGTPREIAQRAKKLVQQQLQLTMSAGVGPNRLIAKIASDYHKPDGLTVVEPAEVLDFLAPLPVDVLRGVGKKLGRALVEHKILTVGQLRNLPQDRLQHLFGERTGQWLFRQARGEASDTVAVGQGRKSISQERTFQQDERQQSVIRQNMQQLAGAISHMARRKKLFAGVVSIKLRLPGFKTYTRQRTLDRPSNIDSEIFQVAWQLYQESGFTEQPLRLLGVGLSHWGDRDKQQLDLFASPQQNTAELYSAIDDIKDRFGGTAIGFGYGEE